MIDRDVHFTFFTSTSQHRAEAIWANIRKHCIAIARQYRE
jgi:hypothetical protein